MACVIFDEVAFWRDETSTNPDIETYNAILPGLTTLPGAMLIGISSPHRKAGLLYDRYRTSYGKPDPNILIVRGPSRTFNPTIPQAIVDAALARDPEAAAAEWLGEFRRDIVAFIDRSVVDAAIVGERYEIPPLTGTTYHAFADPSGGSSDAMTLGIAHNQDGVAVLDCIRERVPPFSPEAVVAEFAATLKSYGINSVTGDRYGGEWPRERFRQHGIAYFPSLQPKSDIYLSFLPLLNSGNVELLDHVRLITQLVNLERRTVRGGRESIDHPQHGHDDLINAAAGALVAAVRPRQNGLIPAPGFGPVPLSRGIPEFTTTEDTLAAYRASRGQ